MYLHIVVVASCLNVVSLRDYRGILLPKIVKIVPHLLNIMTKSILAPFFLKYGVYGMELVSEITLCQNGTSLECQYSIEVD